MTLSGSEGRDALVMIDLQRDFFVNDELERRRDDLAERATRLASCARANDVPVVEVHTVHDPRGSTWTRSMKADEQGMALAGSPGVERLAGIVPGDVVITKTRDSAFFGTDLLAVLRRWGVDRLVLVGVSTESCIAATATEAFAHDLDVIVVKDATASVRAAWHDQALDLLERLYRQRAVSTADVEHMWTTA